MGMLLEEDSSDTKPFLLTYPSQSWFGEPPALSLFLPAA